MTTHTRIAIIFTGSVAILTILFSFLIQGKLYDALVRPTIRYYYVLRFYVSCLPQDLIWGGVIGALILILFIFYRRMARSLVPPPSPSTVPASVPIANPLRDLAVAIRHARRFPLYQQVVINELRRIAVRIIAQRDGISLREARRQFKSGGWCTSKQAQEFLADKRALSKLRPMPNFDRQLNDVITYLEHLERGV